MVPFSAALVFSWLTMRWKVGSGMEDCIFCKIVEGEIPGSKVFENDKILAFHDINPVAPLHLLFIPKLHVTDVVEAMNEENLLSDLFAAVKEYIEKENLQEEHFRLVTNRGAAAGQSVFHLHFHLIGGRGLSWPPG